MKNLFNIEGKVALVTGGSRGIGAMIARGFVENGVKTYISSRKAEVCDELAKELSQHGQCISLPADLSTMAGIESLAAALGEKEEKLDILVNNAGANWGAGIEQFPESGWDKVMDLNVKSPFFLTQKLLPSLKKAGTHESPARIINIASVDGMHAPSLETYSYSSSKAALILLTKTLAKRLARDHINVNAVAPGPFESKMMEATLNSARDAIVNAVPRRRIGEPGDMAGVAIYLSAPASSYVTGAVIPVDGGMVTTL